MYRTVFLLLSSCCFLYCADKKSSAIQLPYYNTPDFTPIFIKDTAALKSSITHSIANFAFLNQDSTIITQEQVKGKIHVANFIFTSCGSICPTMTKNMKLVNENLKNDSNFVLLSYSVTPWIDRPFVLKRYKALHEINNPNWHFLTGNKADIYQLARMSYFAEEDIGYSKDSTEFLHTEHFILVDQQRRIRGIYNGTLALEMQQLIDDINTLKQNSLLKIY